MSLFDRLLVQSLPFHGQSQLASVEAFLEEILEKLKVECCRHLHNHTDVPCPAWQQFMLLN